MCVWTQVSVTAPRAEQTGLGELMPSLGIDGSGPAWVTRRRRGPRVTSVVAAVGLVVLAGCTTVSRTALVGAGTGSGVNADATGPQGSAGDSALVGQGSGGTLSPTVGAGGGAGSQSVSGAESGSETAGAGPGGGGGGNTTGQTSSKVSPTSSSKCKAPVRIGISYSSDEGQALAAFGAGPNAAGDAQLATQYAQYQAQANQTMADYINSHGGLGPGCQIVLSYHDFHILGSDGFTGESQTECTDFSQDQHVLMAFSEIQETGLIIPCLAKAGVVSFFDSVEYSPSPADFARYRGYLYELNVMTPYRFRSYIDLLNRYGYFGTDAQGNKDAKPVVGILLADQGDGHNQYLVNDLWVPALNKLGIKSVVYSYTNGTGSEASLGSESQSFSSAVLQFRAQGVDHVLFTPDGGNAVFIFPPAANAQQFVPRYGMTTANGATLWSLASSSEQGNAMLVSYAPSDTLTNGGSGNTNLAQFNSNPRTSTQATCAQIFNGKIPSGQTLQGQFALCDRYLLLQQALKGQPAVTAQTLLAGMDTLANRYVPAGAYANPLFSGSDHYDGASAVRVAQWDKSNSAWNYVSPVTPVPLFNG